jgi:hypothetical protein
MFTRAFHRFLPDPHERSHVPATITKGRTDRQTWINRETCSSFECNIRNVALKSTELLSLKKNYSLAANLIIFYPHSSEKQLNCFESPNKNAHAKPSLLLQPYNFECSCPHDIYDSLNLFSQLFRCMSCKS